MASDADDIVKRTKPAEDDDDDEQVKHFETF